MISVLAYCCLMVLALGWIYRDSGTEDVFIVYGSQFRTACDMKAWSAFVACGWRLLLLLTLATACMWLTVRAIDENPLKKPPFLLYAIAGMMVAAIGFLFPWISLCRRRRINRFIRSVAQRLLPTAMEFAEQSDLTREYQPAPADYQTDGNWLAWLPNDELWQRPETQATWFRIAPVIYATSTVPRTLAISVTWQFFLIWGDATPCRKPGQLLPFTAGGTRFMARTIRRLAAQGKWSILRVEMLGDQLDV